MLYSISESISNQTELVRLWMHESYRVYGDKLVDSNDVDSYEKLVIDTIKKAGFEDLDEGQLFSKPLIYCHFAEGIGESKYLPIRKWEQLNKLLREGIQLLRSETKCMSVWYTYISNPDRIVCTYWIYISTVVYCLC
jgi:dynein heavy chain